MANSNKANSDKQAEKASEQPEKKQAQGQRKDHEVIFYSYPKLLFTWPIIVLGPLFWLLWLVHVPAEPLAWVYLMVSVLVVLTIGVDVERNHAVFWAVVFLLFFSLGLWLQDAKNFTLFGDVYRLFNNMDLEYDPTYGIATSIFLMFPWCVMFIWVRVKHRWRVTHNEFEHCAWGRADDALARGAKRVRSTYPDLFELLLAGAGTLIVYSAPGGMELRRISHVPMIHSVRKRLSHILEMSAVAACPEEPATGEAEAGGVVQEQPATQVPEGGGPKESL